MNPFEMRRVNSGSKRVKTVSKRGRINKSFVETRPESPGKPTYYFDDLEPGFGLRVTGSTKTYMCQGWLKGAQPPKKIRLTLGRHGRLTAEEARKLAAEKLREITVLGEVPGARAEKAQITLRAVFEDWSAKPGPGRREKTVSIYRRVLEGSEKRDEEGNRVWIGFSDWLDQPISSITSHMVRERYRLLARHKGVRSNEDGAKAAAAQAMRVLKTLCNYAIHAYRDDQGMPMLFTFNPVEPLEVTDKGWNAGADRRDDVIKEADLPRWYKCVRALGDRDNNRNVTASVTMSTAADAMLLCLFTGLRRTAALQIKWQNIDWTDRTITIPAADDKTDRQQVLPMSDFVYDLLQERKSAPIVDQIYVFPGDVPGHPLQEPKRAIAKVVDRSGVKFSMHTLRRTFATTAQKRELRMQPHIVKHLLHHSLGRDVTENHYLHVELEDLRQPMQLICDYLCDRIGVKKKSRLPTLADNRSPRTGQTGRRSRTHDQ